MANYNKSEHTREKLMLAAEALIASRGIGGASAREIAKEAGLRNNCSVQYHFGSIESLLEELVRFRMGQLEEIRASMVETDAFSRRNPSLIDLMKIICLPHLSIMLADGAHGYAAFLCQYLPIYHPMGFKWLMRTTGTDLLVTRWTIREMRAALPQLPADTFDRRLTSAALLFLNTLQGFSRASHGESRVSPEDSAIQDAIRQSVAGLCADQATN